MSERITKLQRWLDLVAFLIGRRYPVTAEDIMENVPAYAERWRTGEKTPRATAKRTFERDKDDLREHGIPIETVKYTLNHHEETVGYLLTRRDFYLPYLKLVEEATPPRHRHVDRARVAEVELADGEARLALDALGRVIDLPAFPLAGAARSAFRKLTFDLDPDQFRASPVLYAERPGADTILENLRTLSDALLARKYVRFRYHGIHRGESTDREVAPYGLYFKFGHWYLVAYDKGRDGIRIFRTARMESVELANPRSPKTADFEVAPGFRIQDHVTRMPWELGGEDEEPLRAEVLFRFPASLWAERNGKGTLVETRADGSAVRAFDVQQVDPFLRWILSLQGEAEILGPQELVEEMRGLARNVVALYQEVSHG